MGNLYFKHFLKHHCYLQGQGPRSSSAETWELCTELRQPGWLKRVSSERLRTNGIWARKARGVWISLRCCKGKSCGGHRTPQVLVFGRLRYNTRILSAYLAPSPGWGPIWPKSLNSRVSEVLQQRVWKWGSRVLKNHSYAWQSCSFPWDNLSHCLEFGGLYFPGGKTCRLSWTLHMK